MCQGFLYKRTKCIKSHQGKKIKERSDEKLYMATMPLNKPIIYHNTE